MAEENSRFIDNQDGTVTDVQTGLMWTREDTWLTEAQWVSWDEALRYTHDLSYRKFAGYNDWRLPEQEELLTLVDNEHTIKDKYGKEIRMNPAFAEGPLATVWTADGIGQDGYIVNFTTGETGTLYKSKSGRMAARAVRGTPLSEQRPSK